MARVLINFFYDRAKDKFYLLENNGVVFADQPYAVRDTDEEVREPLIVPVKNFPTVKDRASYEAVNRIFSLVPNLETKKEITFPDGSVVTAYDGVEDPTNPKAIRVWLPKDVDLSTCRISDKGAIFFEEKRVVETNDEPKQEGPKKHQRPPKPENKEA